MQVQEIMTRPVTACAPGTNAAVAAELMWTQNCGSLPVVEDGKVVGIVTDRDLFIALGTSNRRPSELTMGEIMNTDLSLCGPSDNVQTALKAMAQAKLHRLPVVDEEGMLQGLLSLDDIVTRDGGLRGEDLMRAMQSICTRPERSTSQPVGA